MNLNQNFDPLNIILVGTSDFAVPIFESIYNDKRFYVKTVITQPDKPVGRKKIITSSPVKEWALEHDLQILQPKSLKQTASARHPGAERSGAIGSNSITYETLKNLKPDLMLVVAYGKLIPQVLIDLPKFKTANVHPSLLPEYRGPSPMQYTILKGNTKTGVSIMLIDEQMDHGPILQQIEYTLTGHETYPELSDTLSQLSTNIVPDTLYKYCEGKIKPADQDHDTATICKLITTNDGLLFWEKPAIELERRIRALNPEPGTYCLINDQRLKVRSVRIIDQEGMPGTFFKHEGYLAVQCGEDALLLEEVQPAGKQWMSGEQYLNGYGLPN